MNWRLNDIPVYQATDTLVSAEDFNLVNIAFNRLGDPLSIPLTGLRKLELILSPDAWIVIDNDLNQIPILAWVDFESEGRSTLHEAIPCRLKTYHMHATVILEMVTQFMEQELAKRLSELQTACEIENVTPLKKD